MVGIGVQNHVGIRIELVLEANLPHVGAVEIRLGDAKDDQTWNHSSELGKHQPPGPSSRDLGPFAMDWAIAAEPTLALVLGVVLGLVATECWQLHYDLSVLGGNGCMKGTFRASSRIEITRTKRAGSAAEEIHFRICRLSRNLQVSCLVAIVVVVVVAVHYCSPYYNIR